MTHRTLPYEWSFLGLVIVALTMVRLIDPGNIIGNGSDVSSHLMRSLRLFDTSPLLVTPPLTRNSFFNIINYEHGYTTVVLPALLYLPAFALAQLPITDVNLAAINATLAAAGLALFHIVFRKAFGPLRSLLLIGLIGLAPQHVTSSTTLPAYTPLLIALLWGSFGAAWRFLETRDTRWLLAFHGLTFLYVGSDVLYVAGLGFQVLFIAALARSTGVTRTEALRLVYGSPISLISIVMPTILFVAVWAVLHSGPLVRILDQLTGLFMASAPARSDAATSPALLTSIPGFLSGLFLRLGPIAALALPGTYVAVRHRTPLDILALAIVVVMMPLLLIRSGSIHTLLLAPPLAYLTMRGMLLLLPGRKWVIAGVTAALAWSAIHVGMVVFHRVDGVAISERAGKFFSNRQPETGGKAVALMIRSGMLPVRDIRLAYNPDVPFFSIWVPIESAYFHLGGYPIDHKPGLDCGDPGLPDAIALNDRTTPFGIDADKIVAKCGYHPAVEVVRDGKRLLEVFLKPGLAAPSGFFTLDAHAAGLEFDQRYGNRRDLPRYFLY